VRQPSLHSKQQIALGIWSGKEVLSTRVISQAGTWMRLWDKVHVFTDGFADQECENLSRAAYPCQVICVDMGNLAEHLEGSEWRHRWYFAQPRFLPSMEALWRLNPNATWFLFGDDDTYFLRPSVEAKLSPINSSVSFVVGKFWTSWERVTQDVPPLRPEHPFAQGGAGVAISNAMMQRIGPHLRNCSLSFNDPDFAGSMRFAMCAERVVGPVEWSIDSVIITWPEGFHSMPPDWEIGQRTVKEPPATFHQITPTMFSRLWNGHAVEYLHAGKHFVLDLGAIAFSKQRIKLGTERNSFEWRFGHWIALEDSSWNLLRAIEPWKVVIGNLGDLQGFTQMYEGGVEVVCECDDAITTSSAHFSHFADDLGSKPVMKLDCGRLALIQW
jgi:hypothetical protein